MKKFLILTGILGGTLLIGGVILGYYANHKLLPRLPGIVADALKPSGIELAYGSLEPTSVPFSLSLRKVKIEGPRAPYFVEIDQFRLRPSLAMQFPPLRVTVTLDKVSVAENPAMAPPPRQPSSVPPSRAAVLFALFGWMEGEVRINSIRAPAWGLMDADAVVGFEGIKIANRALQEVVLQHKAAVKKLASMTALQGTRWTGTTIYSPERIQATSHHFTLGPIDLVATGTYLLGTSKWKGSVMMAETDFSNATAAVKAALPPWVTKASGTLGANFQFQGVGTSLQSSNIDGTLAAKQLDLVLKKPEIDGRLLADLNLRVARREKTDLDLTAKIDMTDTRFQPDPEFKKPPGVPFVLDVSAKGNEEHFTISSATLKFLNAQLTGKGEGSVIPSKYAKVEVKLPKTDIAGWEKFFPNYTELKATGSLEGDLSYQGPLGEFRKGDLKARFNAAKLTIPIWSKLFPFDALRLQGIAAVNSQTDVQWTKGEIRKLASQMELDLTKSELKYSDSFHKPMGVRSLLSLSIVSSQNRAQLRRAVCHLGGLKTTAKGSIENFKNPQANIKFDLAPTSPGMLFAFTPALVERGLSDTKGVVSIKGTVSGPFLEPSRSRFTATVEARDVDANQAMAASSAKLKDILNGRLSGVASLETRGADMEEWKRNLTGKGALVLNDGILKTFRFTQKPLEALQKIPMIGSKITRTEWDERFQTIKAEFSIQDQKASFSDVVMRGAFFDFTAQRCHYGFAGDIEADGSLYPKAPLISQDVLASLRDSSGKPNIPLKISGTIQAPVIALDGDILQKRIQEYLERQVAAEKDKLLQGVRKTVEQKARETIDKIFR